MKGRKKQYLRTMGWMLLTGAWMFSSCADDEWVKNEPATTGEGIFFGVTSADSDWQPDTRSTTSGKNFVLRGENTEDTLCVSTSVMEGINASREVHSRGTTLNSLANQSFNVTAYYSADDATTPSTTYFEKETVSVGENGSATNMTNTYYWPQNGKLTFLATANGDDNLTINDKNENADYLATPSLSYTVPDEVKDQKDVMVAYTNPINNGTSGSAVPLTFNHLCAAVQFQLTSEVENAISSIFISGVKGGTVNYTYQNDATWTPDLTKCNDKTYSINFETPITGTVITSDNNNTTLLLAPQILTESAKITVTFSDDRPSLSTADGVLNGKTWEMGKTFIFKLSITPEYTLEFVEKTEYPKVLDAHYIITKIYFSTDVNWTLSIPEDSKGWAYLSKEKSNQGTNRDNKKNEITTGQLAGKWSYVEKCNKQTISGTVKKEGTPEEVYVYLLLRENPNSSDRTLTVQLSKAGNQNGVTSEYTQLGYQAFDTFGMERLEDANSPFGFTYDGKVKYVYKSGSGLFAWLISSLANGWTSSWSFTPNDMTLQFTSNVDDITDAKSGLDNTKNAMTLLPTSEQNWLVEQGWYIAEGNISIDTNAAVHSCLSKNSYGDFSGDKDDSDAVLDAEDVVWYLPAIDEMLSIKSQDNDSRTSLYTESNAPYWTSTAIANVEQTDEQGTTTTIMNAYSWFFGAVEGIEKPRTTTLKVRCARSIPNSGTSAK